MNKIANTNKQLLSEHSFAIGFLARNIVHSLTNGDTPYLEDAAYFAGCFHDFGKLDVNFQNFLKKKTTNQVDDGVHIEGTKFSFEKYPRHNEISLLFFTYLYDKNRKLQPIYDIIQHSIFWHHAKPVRKIPIDLIRDIYLKFGGNQELQTYLPICNGLISSINSISAGFHSIPTIENFSNYSPLPEDRRTPLWYENLPKYKTYPDQPLDFNGVNKYVLLNNDRNIVRSALIKADRIISKLPSTILSDHIKNQTLLNLVPNIKSSNLNSDLKSFLDEFFTNYPGPRTVTQSEKAKLLSDSKLPLSILSGPAGVGKTKIAIEWAYNKGSKKIWWVCPRVAVCKSVFHELIEYLPSSSIEVLTGDLKLKNRHGECSELYDYEHFESDIIITTIDQIINLITSHNQSDFYVDFLQSTIIVDEVHEIVSMEGFNILLLEILKAKSFRQDTLLMTATHNYVLLKYLLGINIADIIDIDSFNQTLYQIFIEEYDEKSDINPLTRTPLNTSTFIISNTAKVAQHGTIDNDSENSVLLHGSYIHTDKVQNFDQVFESFGKCGNHSLDIIRSSPIIQASLNISCQNMITEITSPENTLQRLGRLGRFGENEISKATIVIPHDYHRSKNKKFAGSLNYGETVVAWVDFLKSNITSKNYTISELYQLYNSFYKNNKLPITNDLLKALNRGVGLINDMKYDPIQFFNKRKLTDSQRIKSQSLRGKSCFAKMAIYDLNTRDFSTYISDNITIDEDTNDNDFNEIIKFMYDNHQKVDSGWSVNGQNFTRGGKTSIIKEAKCSDFPVYASYTQSDLAKIGWSQIPDHFRFYVKKGARFIGVMNYKDI